MVRLIQAGLDFGHAVADDARGGRADVDVVEVDAAAVDVLLIVLGGKLKARGMGRA